jgi:hypothetical protein
LHVQFIEKFSSATNVERAKRLYRLLSPSLCSRAACSPANFIGQKGRPTCDEIRARIGGLIAFGNFALLNSIISCRSISGAAAVCASNNNAGVDDEMTTLLIVFVSYLG